MTVRSLSEVFLPGAVELPERLRTLSVTPTRFVEPGTTVEATFGFYNSGGAVATGLRVRFAQPEGLEYVAGSAQIDGVPQTTTPDGAFVAPNGALLGQIAPGIERRVSILYRVAGFIEDGTTLAIQAALAANETTVVGSNIARLVARSRPLLLNAQTNVSLDSTVGAEPGRELLVRARVTNQGQSSATDVVLIFPVPQHTRYSHRTVRVDGRLLTDDRTAPFEASASTIVAERLAPGQSVIADFIAIIESPLDNGTAIQAKARFSSREIPEFEIKSNEILVASMPNFDGDGTALLIAGDDDVVPGMRLRMGLRASNVGTSSARRVTAHLALPTGIVYSPGSATLDGLPIGDELFDALTYAFDSIAPGCTVQLAFDAVVVAPAPPDEKLPIAASLKWETGERNFTRTLTIRSEPRFTRAKNSVERSGPPFAEPGECVTFVIHVLNEGTAAASDVRLLLRGDSTLTVVGAHSNNTNLEMVENALVLPSLQPHVEHLVTVTTLVSSPLQDKAEVTLGAELVTAQLGGMDLGVASYIIRSQPRFSAQESLVRLQSTDALRPSRPVDVGFTIVNNGTDIARDVRVVLSYPPEVNVNAVEGAPFSKGELLLDTLAPGTSREVQVQISLGSFVPTESLVTLESRIEAAGLSPVPLNTIQIETRAEAEFAGELMLLANPSDQVDAGAPLSYTLRFRNVGDGPAQSVIVRVRPPEQLIYMPMSTSVNGTHADDESGTSPLWSLHGLMLTDVDPGVPVEVSFNAVVVSPITSGTVLSAQATLEWEEQSLTVVSDEVFVRSTPEFASSPGGRSISIARLASQPGSSSRESKEIPIQLARPRLIETARPEAAPIVEEQLPSLEAAPVLESDEDFELPFFSPPPSVAAVETEEDPSSFSFVVPLNATPIALSSEVEFGVPPSQAHELDETLHDVTPEVVATQPTQPEKVPEPIHEAAFVEHILAQDLDSQLASQPNAPEGTRSNQSVEVSEPPRTLPVEATEIIPEAREVHQKLVTDPVSVLAFAPDRLRRTLSFLQQSDYGKLISHLFALEAFFPDSIQDEPELDDLFVAVRDAFRSTLDRLFVRLRLPRYSIAARDLEDRSSREALLGLAQRVSSLPPLEAVNPLAPVGSGIRIRGPIDRESLRHALSVLADAPLGGVTPWIACVSMLGTTVETPHENVEVLGAYRDSLLAVLRVLEALPMSEFHRVLTSSANPDLDKALNDVVRVLGGPVEATVR